MELSSGRAGSEGLKKVISRHYLHLFFPLGFTFRQAVLQLQTNFPTSDHPSGKRVSLSQNVPQGFQDGCHWTNWHHLPISEPIAWLGGWDTQIGQKWSWSQEGSGWRGSGDTRSAQHKPHQLRVGQGHLQREARALLLEKGERMLGRPKQQTWNATSLLIYVDG